MIRNHSGLDIGDVGLEEVHEWAFEMPHQNFEKWSFVVVELVFLGMLQVVRLIQDGSRKESSGQGRRIDSAML
jgi:hypothetical protein